MISPAARSVADAGANRWWRRPAIVFGVAAGLILLRTLVYLLFEQLSFDSDQAIVGLMARHLSEGRAFPLFFYGQSYMLGVEAWVAAPFFAIAGASVRTLRASLVAWNLGFAFLLIAGLQRDAGLRPWPALVASLFFLLAPPSITTQLVQAQGGIAEPFVYVAALWFLRRRPLWFGIVLAIGFRNREFTMYAVPVLLALEGLTGVLTWSRLRDWLVTAVTFAAISESIGALAPLADLQGPGTRGQLIGGFATSQVGNLLDRFNWQSGEIAGRVTSMAPRLLAWFAGASQVDTSLPLSDRPWMTLAATAFLLIVAGRLALLLVCPSTEALRGLSLPARVRQRLDQAPFAFYMLGVGLVACAAFVAGKPVVNGYSRYALLGILAPVGLTAALLALEPRSRLRAAAMTAVIAWGMLAAVDHVHVLTAYIRDPPTSAARQTADRLIARRVPVAKAGYWRAYVVTFLSGERVRVASSDFIRIQEYQDLFDDHPKEAVVISEQPCPNGERINAGWYLCEP